MFSADPHGRGYFAGIPGPKDSGSPAMVETSFVDEIAIKIGGQDAVVSQALAESREYGGGHVWQPQISAA
jgi:hypothetical protein